MELESTQENKLGIRQKGKTTKIRKYLIIATGRSRQLPNLNKMENKLLDTDAMVLKIPNGYCWLELLGLSSLIFTTRE